MGEAWVARIMALEKELAELKEAVLAVQERDGKPMVKIDSSAIVSAIAPVIDDELRSLAMYGTHGAPEQAKAKMEEQPEERKAGRHHVD